MSKSKDITLPNLVNEMINGNIEVSDEYIFSCKDDDEQEIYILLTSKNGANIYTIKSELQEKVRVTDLSLYTLIEVMSELSSIYGVVNYRGTYLANSYIKH